MTAQTSKVRLAKGKYLTRIVSSAVIRKVPEQVFEYVTTAGNWPQWHPSSLGVTGAVDHSAEIGEEITEQFLVAGRKGEAVWTVIERQFPLRWGIEGKIKNSESGGVVSYSLTRTEDGTLFHREFTYHMPNLLWQIINKLILQRRVQAESDEAVRRLKNNLEGK